MKQPNTKKKTLGVLAGSALLLLGAVVASDLFGIRWNGTASLPIGFYLEGRGAIERGSIVLACPEPSEVQKAARERGYLHYGADCPGGFAPLLKKAMALPGDVVKATPAGIQINGVEIKNTARLAADSEGRAMPPLPESGEVKPGTVWLLSDYEQRSYDSRYFGPVPLDSIEGTATPIWTFKD